MKRNHIQNIGGEKMTALEGIYKIFKLILWSIFNSAKELINNETIRPFIIAIVIIIAISIIIKIIIHKAKIILN